MKKESDKNRKIFAGIALIFLIFILASVFYLFGMSKDTVDLAFSFVAGVSMIVLPCTLPLVFIIVPLSMGKGYRKGLGMAVMFGLGLAVTLSIYGIFIALAGSALGLDQAAVSAGIFSKILFMIGGVVAFLFGLSELKLINFSMPSFARTPKFIEKRKDYSKVFFLGLLLGNAGVGCPNPLFYILLGDIAVKGSVLTGWWLGFVHGVGRATPLIFLSILGILGVNATTSIMKHQAKIKKITGWFLIFLGAFIFISGGAHQWYEEGPVHTGWNKIINVIAGDNVSEAGLGDKEVGHGSDLISSSFAPWVLILLILVPIIWYYIRKMKNKKIEKEQNEK